MTTKGGGSNDWLYFVLLLIVMMIGQAIWNLNEPKKERSTWSDNKQMAYIQCKEFVKERLKSPSTADFPMLDYSAAKLGEDGYLIKGHVDAQNSFGAKLRGDFVCNIEWNGGDTSAIRNWKLISLEM